MNTITESGHEKNIANFEHLINVLTGFGTGYNPGNASIALSALQTALTDGKNSISAEKTDNTNRKGLANDREIAFEPLKGLCTRLLNTLISCQPSSLTIDDYKTYNRKIQGARAKRLPKIPELDQNGKPVKHISVSQRSYDSQIEFFNKIVVLLSSLPSYVTNEPSYKIPALQTLLNDLRTANSNARTAKITWENTRIARNKILYEDVTGILALARAAKAFVKGKYGIDSPEFALVSVIKFVRITTKI